MIYDVQFRTHTVVYLNKNCLITYNVILLRVVTGAHILQEIFNDPTMYELVSKWLNDYHAAKNEHERAKAKALIVTRMMPIVKRIAKGIARRSYDPIEDLTQAGAIGLLKAIDSFTPEINENFKFYAGSLIIGEMKHYIRDKLNTIRVPAHIQELSTRINFFISTLTVDELNNLTDEYVANALNVPTKDIEIAKLSNRRKLTLSLDSIYVGDEHNLSYEEIIPEENYKEKVEIEDARLIIGLIIARLPKEYRKLISLYYYKDMNKREIANKLNISEMQVVRKLNKAFELLHEMIADSQLGTSLMEIY